MYYPFYRGDNDTVRAIELLRIDQHRRHEWYEVVTVDKRGFMVLVKAIEVHSVHCVKHLQCALLRLHVEIFAEFADAIDEHAGGRWRKTLVIFTVLLLNELRHIQLRHP